MAARGGQSKMAAADVDVEDIGAGGGWGDEDLEDGMSDRSTLR